MGGGAQEESAGQRDGWVRKVQGKEWMGGRAQEKSAGQRDGWVKGIGDHAQISLGKCDWWKVNGRIQGGTKHEC